MVQMNVRVLKESISIGGQVCLDFVNIDVVTLVLDIPTFLISV